MNNFINSIEQTYRDLIRNGAKITKIFSANPADHGFVFPKDILKEAYNTYFDSLHYNPHPKGALKAREAITGHYNSVNSPSPLIPPPSRGREIDAGNILLTSGTSESFFHIFSILTAAGEEILV